MIMAIIYIAWENDSSNKGFAAIASLRSDGKLYSRDYLNSWIEDMKKKKNCTLITKSRTDKQSLWEQEIFRSPFANPDC